jgi:hypothetical protein
MKVVSLSALHTGCLYPHRKYSWYSYLLNAESTLGPEGLCQWKITVTPSGIEPATFRFASTNQLRHRVPPLWWWTSTGFSVSEAGAKPRSISAQLSTSCTQQDISTSWQSLGCLQAFAPSIHQLTWRWHVTEAPWRHTAGYTQWKKVDHSGQTCAAWLILSGWRKQTG